MIRIHFPALREDTEVIPLAHACGVGRFEREKAVDVHRFEKLFAEGKELWQAVGMDEAQVVVYPHWYRSGAETGEFCELAKQRGLPLFFFNLADDATPVHLPYGVIYRASIISDQMTPSERGLVAFSDDLLIQRGRRVAVRGKREMPSVGFCGYVGTAFNRAIYTLSGRAAKVHGLRLRHRALSSLRRSTGVECKFIERSRFWGGALGRFHRNVGLQVSVRQEYMDNVFDTDYTLCLRGAGNFSFRFYEVLSAGRIPLFINTQCVLPFADQIDWKRHCVWVEEPELKRAGEVLMEFHRKLSAEEFQQMQSANRQLWEDWLEPTSFYRRVLDSAMAVS